MKKTCALLVAGLVVAGSVRAADVHVTDILQHGTYAAVYLSPDPGPLTCQVGQPYLLTVDDSAASKQRFSMIMLVLATGKQITVFQDGCDTAIWAQSRPIIHRLILKSTE